MATIGSVSVLLLTACGGGSAPEERVDETSATARLVRPTVLEAELLDWAEQHYPVLFPAAGKVESTQSLLGGDGVRRTYPGTGNSLSVQLGAAVYGRGSFTGGALAEFGRVDG